MKKRIPLTLAGIVFCLVTVIHILRLFYQWEIVVAGQIIPMSISIYGAIITGFLALWMFIAASSHDS